MRITDLLKASAIDLNVSAKSKEDVLKQAVELMAKQGNITDKEEYLKAVFAREEEGTTGVGEGIAIPHGRCEGVSDPGLIAMVIPAGVDYEALDDEPVQLLFLIAANPKSGSAHIDILSKLSGMLMHEEFTAALKAAKTPEEFLKIIDDAESEKDSAEEVKEDAKAGQKKILAVTGCPTGIAHTFMAAEALEKTAKEKGCFIKVETRGSGGAKNVLTESEIKEADCIIVAADTKVPMDRFDGKKLIEVPVSDGISKADKLIERAMKGDAKVFHGNGEAAVMVGGMVPPCAIALATLLFKNKFTAEERKSGPTNFIMGLAFITEGAIPFAAADPLRVLPSCIAGSAVAGALSMAFNCTLMAPHGGIFVFPVVGNALMYLVALIVGTIISAVLLGLLKKPVEQR